MKKVFLIFIMAIAVNGCAKNTSGIQAELTSDGATEVKAFKLANDIVVSQLDGEFIDGLYRAKVKLENKKSKTQTLQYQIRWLDNDGMETSSGETAWEPITIYGNDTKSFSALAMDASTTGFKVNVRDLEANKTFKTNFFGIK